MDSTFRRFRPPLCLLALTLAGCRNSATIVPPTTTPEVSVATPLERDDTPYIYESGRTEPVEDVEVKAQVSGYLDEVAFTDGQLVKEGDLLFQIDPRPYQATLSQAQASVAEAKAALAKAEADLQRAQPLLSTRAISAQEFDQIVAARAVSEAALQAANAAVESAQLNLDFTTIKAPISGRVSNTQVTKGNLISESQDKTLTTIVKPDPVYVYFDLDEASMLRVRAERAKEGHQIGAGNLGDEKIPMDVGLVSDEGYPHHGLIDFVDNQVNPSTGTIRVRGVLSNPDEPFVPGLYATMRVQCGAPRPGLFVAERALGIDQGQRFVFVVGDDDKVKYQAVEVGPSQNGLRRVLTGLTADERVIVNGVNRVRPGMVVAAQEVSMNDFITGEAAKPAVITDEGASQAPAPSTSQTPAAPNGNK